MILEYRAIGFFLAYYERNLEHILHFQQFLKRKGDWKKYYEDKRDSFPRFLAEFRVARNVKKGSANRLLVLTEKWIVQEDVLDVDGFALYIQRAGLTHGKKMTSLASKILFLYRPHILLPLDSQVRASIGLASNDYADYVDNVADYRDHKAYRKCLEQVSNYAEKIEERFQGKIGHLLKIRANRMLDIWLWANNGVEDLR